MYDFQKLADVELLEEVPEGASAFVEVDGAVKRVPGSGLGGGGVATAILRYEVSDERIATRVSAGPSLTEEPFVCDNYTYEQAKAILDAEQPLAVMALMDEAWMASVLTYVDSAGYIRMFFIPDGTPIELYWDTNGFYAEQSK